MGQSDHFYRVTNKVTGQTVAVRGLRGALPFLHAWYESFPIELWRNRIDELYLHKMSAGRGYHPTCKLDPHDYFNIERLPNLSEAQFLLLPDHYMTVLEQMHPVPPVPAKKPAKDTPKNVDSL